MGKKFVGNGFADQMMGERGQREMFLDRTNRLIDWKHFEKILRVCEKRPDAAGNDPYPPIVMFKALLVQRWHCLSDPEMETALYDRLSFIRFCGLSVMSSVPDHSTIWRFREELLQRGLFEKLFAEVNRQLMEKGIMVKETKGAIVDATLIKSSRRLRKVIEVVPEDRKEEESAAPHVTVTYSDDADATCAKKGNIIYYGYKAHVAAESEDGFILGGHVTPANVADITQLEKTLEVSCVPKGSFVVGDKGYCSEGNRNLLGNKGYGDLIMHKAFRNTPLTGAQKIVNRLISSIRYKVEQVFGILKRHYGFERMRYTGLAKANMEFLLNAMAYNIKKAVLKTV